MSVHRLGADGLKLLRQTNQLYAEVFEDPGAYAAAPPGDAYLSSLLADPHFVSLVAMDGERVVGALTGYVLRKFERERAEVFIYDLAVRASHRRQGIATRLIRHLQGLAPTLGAWVIFVQADHGDDPAICLYESLGTREQVLHFDIPVRLSVT